MASPTLPTDAPPLSSPTRLRPIRILLHGEDGNFPFLTPHLLRTYFPSTDDLVENHLILGVAIKDSCVVPLYKGDDSFIDCKKRKRSRKTSAVRSSDGVGSAAPEPSAKKARANSEAASNVIVSGERNATPSGGRNNKKPTGFTFDSRTLEWLHIPPGYRTLAIPTFDLLDDLAREDQNGRTTAVQSTADALNLCTPNGRQKISPRLYAQIAKVMKCDEGCVGLFDTAFDDEGKRRKNTAVERTGEWLDRYVKEKNWSELRIWGPIVGGSDMTLRTGSLRHVLKHADKLSGAALVGWHRIPLRSERKLILERCIGELQREMPSQAAFAVLETKDVLQIIDAAIGGVDVVGTGLPARLARQGKGLVVNVADWRDAGKTESIACVPDEDKEDRDSSGAAIETGVAPHIKLLSSKEKAHADQNVLNNLGESATRDYGCIDLSDAIHVCDTSPLVPDCPCPSCRDEGKHSRAYLHHLIKAKEMLSEILLFIHNLHHILRMVREMSAARNEGRAHEFREFVEAQLLQ